MSVENIILAVGAKRAHMDRHSVGGRWRGPGSGITRAPLLVPAVVPAVYDNGADLERVLALEPANTEATQDLAKQKDV
jgi:hypothetical protein